jgi:hypothetical protein
VGNGAKAHDTHGLALPVPISSSSAATEDTVNSNGKCAGPEQSLSGGSVRPPRLVARERCGWHQSWGLYSRPSRTSEGASMASDTVRHRSCRIRHAKPSEVYVLQRTAMGSEGTIPPPPPSPPSSPTCTSHLSHLTFTAHLPRTARLSLRPLTTSPSSCQCVTYQCILYGTRHIGI